MTLSVLHLLTSVVHMNSVNHSAFDGNKRVHTIFVLNSINAKCFKPDWQGHDIASFRQPSKHTTTLRGSC